MQPARYCFALPIETRRGTNLNRLTEHRGRSGAAPHLQSARFILRHFQRHSANAQRARACDAVAFHQIVQDRPVRVNSLRFGMICQAAVISIISNPKFKGLAPVSLVTLRVSRKEQPITKVTMKLSGIARQAPLYRVAISGAGLGAEEIATNGHSAPFGPVKVNPRRHWRRLTMKPSGGRRSGSSHYSRAVGVAKRLLCRP